jgi:aminopeptidase N
MRDFAFALGPFVTDSRSFEDIQVNAWVLPDHQGDMDRVLELATGQIRVMTEDVGPYPYAELDVVDAPGAFGGIEYPGLVFIGTIGTPRLVSPVVHEVAHQWFYGLIGNDQLEEPWLDEAAATYAEALYYEGTGASATATGMLSELRSRVRSSPDPTAPIGLAVRDYPSTDEYSTIVYLKGALFFEALRNQIGDDAFFDFLHDYYSKYHYGFATMDEFEDVAETACGCQLRPLFEAWVIDGGPIPGP